MASNTTTFSAYDLPPLPSYTLSPLPPVLPWISDVALSLALPVIAYWVCSLFFHAIDELDLFPQYRLHTPAEVLKRNHVSRWDVFRDVVVQQIIQTIVGLGFAWLEPEAMAGKETYDIAVWAQRVRMLQRAVPGLLSLVGVDAKGLARRQAPQNQMLAGLLAGGIYPSITQIVVLPTGEPIAAPAFAEWELLAGKAIYHVLIPAAQFFFAVMVVDTWQYFLHRAMHMNKWLYTTFHSRHHRLYVPYAYGALYNHPFEGFLLDTCGTGLAYMLAGMSIRQSMWFFTMSTIKTVDDHCGYSFPWDPLQHVTSNNAGYHDVHHQSWGIKTNFSQPFFTFWDGLLGTKWTGGDVSARYERARIAAQKKLDAEMQYSVAPITASRPEDSTTQPSSAPYELDSSRASSVAQSATPVLEPRVPAGKATHQALASRQQVLDADGRAPLAEESAEEVRALRRSPRKRAKSSGFQGFADRVSESLQGKGTGVLGVDSRR